MHQRSRWHRECGQVSAGLTLSLLLVVGGGLYLLATGRATGVLASSLAAQDAAGAPPRAAADGAALASKLEDLDARVVELEVEAERCRAARASQTQLIERLRATIDQKDRAFQALIARLEEAEQARAQAPPAPPSSTPPLPRDPLVEALNGLLLEHGIVEYRLLDHGGVKDGVIADSRWGSCNGHGIATAVLTARATVLARGALPGELVIELRDGFISRGSEQTPFTDGVVKIVVPQAIDEITRSAVLSALLPAASAPPVARILPLDRLEPVLSELLEKQGYYLRRIESLDGSDLKRIVLEEGAPGSAPKRTITADTCHVQAVDPGGYIELLFENGSITTRGREMRFYGNRYRLPLPRTSPSEWEAALGAVVVPRLAPRG
ncbi:MAG: hypothetical protein U1E76_07375 [Planctomycetota bacterium]